MTTQTPQLGALSASVQRLRGIVEPLEDTTIAGSAYPSEWTIAQVMSHLGSGAIILRRRLEDAVASATTPDTFAPQTWDEWNAKTPRSQVDEGLVADAACLAAIEGTSDDARREVTFSIGPLSVDFDGLVGLRLNEHAFHTWDIEVALDPAATIPASIAGLVVDNLELVSRFTARPTEGDPTTIRVRTSDPERCFVVSLTADAATLTPSATTTDASDLELPAEAFARLVYGRLDIAHAPPVVGDPAIVDRLRATYPGL